MEAARVRDGTGGARAASLLAWSLAALAIAMFLASVLLLALVRTVHLPDSWDVNLSLGFQVSSGALFRVLTGQQQQSQLAVVVSTLAIAALFAPLHRRFQSLIDRRFYRRKYDAARVLEAFSARLRDETDRDRLEGDMVAVVLKSVQPVHASMWVRPPIDTGDGVGAER